MGGFGYKHFTPTGFAELEHARVIDIWRLELPWSLEFGIGSFFTHEPGSTPHVIRQSPTSQPARPHPLAENHARYTDTSVSGDRSPVTRGWSRGGHGYGPCSRRLRLRIRQWRHGSF